MIYTGENGTDHDKKKADKHLKVGETYTVLKTIIHGWSTDVYLEEVEGVCFNSVHFANAVRSVDSITKCPTPNECTYPNCHCIPMTPVTPDSYDGSKSKPLEVDEVGHFLSKALDVGKSGVLDVKESMVHQPTIEEDIENSKGGEVTLKGFVRDINDITPPPINKELFDVFPLTVRVVSEKQPIIIRVTHEGVYSNLHGKYFDVDHGELNVEGLNRID